MAPTVRTRATSVALAVGTMLIGLDVHLHGGAILGLALRDVLGDALWAMMIAWLVAVARARRFAPHTGDCGAGYLLRR